MESTIKAYIERIISDLDCSKKDKKDLTEELSGHLHMLVEEYKSKGFHEKEAVAFALKDFGDPAIIREGLEHTVPPQKSFFHKIAWLGFGVYALVLLWQLIVFRSIDRLVNWGSFNSYFRIPEETTGFFSAEVWKMNTNIIPFQNTYTYLMESHQYNLDIVLQNTIGNILIFIPLGFFFILLFRKFGTILKVAMAGFTVTAAIEVTQFFLQIGQFDVDDILLNTMGTIVGGIIFKASNKTSRFLKASKSQASVS